MLILKQFFEIQLKKNTSLLLFFLLFSFLFGNIFGINSGNIFPKHPGLLFFVFPLFIELINFLIFVLKKKNFKNTLYFTLISIRRGFLLGIFIEAFKVGS